MHRAISRSSYTAIAITIAAVLMVRRDT